MPSVDEITSEPEATVEYMVAFILMATFVLFLFVFGAFICGLVLKEPDTCFLLAVGRWIVEHQQLPNTDPFSYTYAIAPNGGPFVVYQWLTEVFFYLAVKAVGPIALVILTSVSFAFAFVVMPMMMLRHGTVSMLSSLGLVALISTTSWTHINARPEIFSYALLSLWCLLMLKSDDFEKINIKYVALFAGTTVLWSNLHTGFVTGLVVLLFFCLTSILDTVIGNRKRLNLTCLAAFPLSVFSTFLNPFGYKLWLYLPYLFFTPLNATINELKPVGLASLQNPFAYPFFILVVLFLRSAIHTMRKGLIGRCGTTYLAIGVLAIVAGFSAYRMMIFAAILLAMAIAGVQRRLATVEEDIPLSKIESKLRRMGEPTKVRAIGLYVVSIFLGAMVVTSAVTPAIPQASKAFQPPFAALDYLKGHPQVGHGLNDPHYGDVMMWRMESCPPLFIDSRYDIYDYSLVKDYWSMVNCDKQCSELLNRFGIKWVFLPRNTKLIEKLRSDPQWRVELEDNDSTICVKNL